MRNIKSEEHNIYTVEQNKISLSSYDDKRHLNNNGIKTLAHGHYSIKLNNELKKYYID